MDQHQIMTVKNSTNIWRLLLRNLPRKEILIVQGDLNATIGRMTANGQYRDVISPFGLGVRSERGECILQLYQEIA